MLVEPTDEGEGAEGTEGARMPINVGGSVFLPSSLNGFYNRQNTPGSLGDSEMPERHCDFTVVLTEEELTTLASRKKAATMANHQSVSGGALALKPFRTLNSSSPYIDKDRVYKLRPEAPDKWIGD
jgi:hypothetical protein